MKFVCYTDWVQLPESANELFAQGAKDSVFLSRAWFENLTAAGLDEKQSLALACVEAEGKVLAILPLAKCTGNTGYALKHRYTPVYSLLLADDDQPGTLDCLVEGLSRLPVHSLLLEPVSNDDNRIEGFQRGMEATGFRCNRNFRLYNWIYRVQGQSYAEYMVSRPARLRNTIARKKRKLEREHGYEIRLFTGGDVPQAMSDYYAPYSASWKANEQYVDFLNGIVAGFSRPGWTRLAVLYVQGQSIAAQLWFVVHGKANIFRLAYDEAWKAYSPGSILTSFLMEYVIDVDGVEEIDFLTGNDAYKQDWMSERRELFALSCVKSVKATGRYEQFVDSLKKILKGS
ncbi:MAG: GNAT family N-acetyltransferase [Thiohalophilus sp.]|uniref:GNAT family N-acetyltransferase n=1 Tax=Thiohalophilus sp. TaxID=3028392 RepID=UPI00286FC9D7|nr:GNAT family N-acetyltransferase [Thiohalophilus sp.]MDR9436154.1 GNAT family N-acetyltransferase [Thiohalophilus sp.]